MIMGRTRVKFMPPAGRLMAAPAVKKSHRDLGDPPKLVRPECGMRMTC